MPSSAMLDYALNSIKPVTFVLKNAKNLAPSTISGDGTVAIRFQKMSFVESLLALYGKPIVSTFTNISGQPTPRIYGDSKRNPGINGLYCSFSSR
jgi:tRNA A37 threonylcarbamoyladenosine synthetase subunit TsaC/SUA5/YrdC